jgi:hypothetical protein
MKNKMITKLRKSAEISDIYVFDMFSLNIGKK